MLPVFRSFQTELDRKHDKYERLVKLSRDITVASKRLIFSIHRVNRCVLIGTCWLVKFLLFAILHWLC